MHAVLTAIVAALAVMVTGCGPERGFYTDPDSSTEPGTQIRLWVESHPLLEPYDVALDGCRGWWPNDVDCVLTDEFDSTVRVNAVTPEDAMGDAMGRFDGKLLDLANCTKDADGSYTLAMSRGGGWIEFYPKCFEILDETGSFVGWDTATALTVMIHEVGHELGIPHIPDECTSHAAIVRGKGALCGEAVMNPMISRDTPSLTGVDDLAFHVYADVIELPDEFKACELRARPSF